MKAFRQSGFTLVELLVSLALLGVILTAVVYVNIDTSRSASALQSRNDLMPEMQLAQNYMASKLKEAAYVFPTGSNVQMASTGGTTYNTAAGSYNWKVGTHPIVAFIEPPRMVGKPVTSGGVTTTVTCGTATNTNDYPDVCYAFYAYYAMKRSDYLAAVTGADNPGTNPANDTTSWVLLEYRGYYLKSATNFASGFSPLTSLTGFSTAAVDIPTGNRGRLLMDYLTLSATTPALFNVSASTQQAGVTTVTMNLAVKQIVAGQTVRLPSSSATDFTSLTIYPRNVGKTAVNN